MKNPIPSSVLPHHIGFLGITGSGKTSSAKSAIVEPALERGERVIIIDPAGAWWGLRTKADGKGKGFPIYVFGGQHGDYPLRPHDGALLAEAFATSPDSAVFDVSEMMPSEQAVFFTAFVNTMRAKNRGAVNFVIEESHIFMPQTGAKMGGWAPAMLHAGNNLVSLGRSRGFRIVLLSQRPAKLHKDALTQVQTLVAMRVISPQDREAIGDWMEGQGDRKKEADIINSLASLQAGEGWVWAPLAGHLERARFPMPKTFDSSKAPDFEEKEGSAPVLVPVNMETLKDRLGSAEKERKANDPKELKAEIRRLQGELDKKGVGNTPEQNLAIYDDAWGKGWVHGAQAAQKASLEAVQLAIDKLRNQAVWELPSKGDGDKIRFTVAGGAQIGKTLAASSVKENAQNLTRSPQPVKKTEHFVHQTAQNASTGGGARRILIALAQVSPDGLNTKTLAARAGMAQSGSFRTYLSGLTTSGYITRGSEIAITQEGLSHLGPFDPLPLGADLLTYWLNHPQVGSSHGRILRALAEHPEQRMTSEELCAATGFANSGSFRTYLSKLSTLQLIDRKGGEIVLNPELV